MPLSILEPVVGNHNDLFEIEVKFEVVTITLKQTNITVVGLLINADAGFDSKCFRDCCESKQTDANVCFNKGNGEADRDEYFGQVLYNERYTIKRTNDWMGVYRSILN